ncbi:MAG: NUDIX hydrolase [Acholeplasmatales bacterium]|jgi:ADP-ribose pyrophosphatase|nr:NUDIX hydrolase [Acholeplasmatales bacterium]
MEKFLNRKVIYDGKVVRLELDQVQCSNGLISDREIVRHHGGAGILCITPEDKVLLIRQFRYAYKEILYEIPAGKLEMKEDPLEAAKREFEEETGNHALDMTYLMTIYPTVGYSNEKIYLYLVTKFEQTATHFDEDEDIESAFYDIKEALQMIQSGQIKDAKTICALQTYYLRKMI